MTVTAKTLVSAKTAEAVQTTQYASPTAAAIIDKFTATNYSSAVASLSVNLVAVSGGPSNDNLILKTRALQPGETYQCPELVGQVLMLGGFISTLASAASAITIRVSGREVS
jgi:hypothetical protein